MKKIFSLSLMAVALLISGNAKAATPVTTEAQLVAAVANGGDIILGQDIVLDKTLQIAQSYSTPGKVINLNLNGKTLSNNPAQNISVIELYKGTLNISNGTVKGQYPSKPGSCKDAIIVHGVYQDVTEDWAVLNIKKDAKVISDLNAITVMEFWGPNMKFPSGYYDSKAFDEIQPFSLTSTGVENSYVLESFNGGAWTNPTVDWTKANDLKAYYFTTYPATAGGDNPGVQNTDTTAANKYNATTNKTGWRRNTAPAMSGIQSDKKSSGCERPSVVDYTSSVPHYAKEYLYYATSKTATSYSNFYACYRQYESARANGVKVNIDGYVYGEKYGVKVNGTIRHKGSNNPAKIVVSSTGEVACAADTPDGDKDGTAFYCSGNADYEIKGYIHGNIAVVVKSGDVLIEDAVLEGTGSHYEDITSGGSGMNGGSGCGLIVDTQKGYGGGQSVTVAGDSKISGNSGYAVQEVIIATENSAVSAIDIEGGTIVAGDKGAMHFTEKTASEDKVTVYGANVQGETTIGGDEEDKLDELVGEGTFVTEVIIDGEPTLIVTKGDKPAATEYSINADEIPSSVILKEETVTLAESKTLGYVEMTNATIVTIPQGLTLTIDKLVMGDDAQFIIMPGAKLMVTGEQGINAGKASNLVIKADETGMGAFVFNPAVTSNRNPMATVEFYAKTWDLWGDRSEYKYEIMVSPFKTISALSAKTSDGKQAEYYWSYQYWNGNAWVVANRTTIINVAQAFQPIALGNSTPSDVSTIYTFQGELQGNVSGEFNLERGYNYMGNGYVASMDATKIIEEAVKSGKVEPSIWIWDFETQNYISYTLDKLSEMPNMNALNFFILKATGDAKVDLNYEKLVWDFNNK